MSAREKKLARAAARDAAAAKTAPRRSSWLGYLLRLALMYSGLSVFILRSVDGLVFEPALNDLGLSPEMIFGATWLGAFLIWRLSARRPSLALALAAIAFGALKQYCDTIPTPDILPGQPSVTLVTGANAGIGRAVVEELARQGHDVVMGCRNPARCFTAREAILDRNKSVRAEQLLIPGEGQQGGGLPLDLSRLASVEAWTAAAAASVTNRQIAVLVLNAGFVPFGSSEKKTEQAETHELYAAESGWEAGLYAMYVGHHALVHHLSALSLIGAATRAVVTASDAMRFGSFDDSLLGSASGLGDLAGEVTTGCQVPGPFPATPICPPTLHPGLRAAFPFCFPPRGVGFGAYGRAKLANVFLAREMQRRQLVGSATSVMPGIVNTEVQRRDRNLDAAGLPSLATALPAALAASAAGLAAAPAAVYSTVRAALPPAKPTSATEALSAFTNLTSATLATAVASTTAVLSPLSAVLSPRLLALGEKTFFKLFQRDASVAAAVVLTAAVGPTHPSGFAAQQGYHYFGGRGQALGDASLTLSDADWADRVSR